jgi:hypothetical protein
LTGDICDHAKRCLDGFYQKCAQIAHRTQLQREAKTVVIAPEYYDELAVRIFEMKVISQLLGGECTDIAAIVLLLFVGSKDARHVA